MITVKQLLAIIFTSGIILGIIGIVNKSVYGYSITITSLIFFSILLITLNNKEK